MKKTVALPFLTLREDAVEASPWTYRLNSARLKEARDTASVVAWDNRSTIGLNRTVRVDLAKASEHLAMRVEDLKLKVGARVGAGTGRHPHIVDRWNDEVSAEDPEASPELTLPGNKLTKSVHITTVVYLAEKANRVTPLSPDKAGCTLWSDTVRLKLGEGAPLFPMEVLDLGAWLGAEYRDALWYLDWDVGNWDRDIAASMRLIVNGQHKDFEAKVRALDPLLYQVIAGDVIAQVCAKYLEHPEQDEMQEDSGTGKITVGALARNWLAEMWPEHSFQDIQTMVAQMPAKLSAKAQSLYNKNHETDHVAATTAATGS